MLRIILKIFFEIFFSVSCIYFFANLTPEKTIQLRNHCYNLMCNLSYNIIYVFSVCQIKYNKLRACLIKYLQDYEDIYSFYNDRLIDNNDIITITFFNNAVPIKEIVCSNSKREINNLLIKDNEPINYNLLIMSIPPKNIEQIFVTSESVYVTSESVYVTSESDYNQMNKVMVTSLYNTNMFDFNRSYTYEESSFKFISINLTYNSNTYPIYLKNEEYNYYIVNNIIDKIFVQYYLVNILKVNLLVQLHDFRYILEFIDHNVNMVSLNETQYIIFKKEDYSVLQIEPMREIVIEPTVEPTIKATVEPVETTVEPVEPTIKATMETTVESVEPTIKSTVESENE